MNIYIDLEFTGLHQDTTPISLGMVSDDGKKLYLEFIDYEREQLNGWLRQNVINHLWKGEVPPEYKEAEKNGTLIYDKFATRQWAYLIIKEWLSQWKEVKIWSDCYAYDWVLFCELFGGAMKIPENIYYIPYDLSTLLLAKGLDPDISREKYANHEGATSKHNALHDAIIIQKCVHRLLPKLPRKITTP